MKRTRRMLAVLTAVTVLGAAACSSGDDDDESSEGGGGGGGGGGLLAEVQDRGTLNCGVNEGVPGFGVVDDQGDFAGFDVEFCQVVATAVLGDPDAVEYTPLSADDRFTTLQAGEVDVLIRNTTRTAGRDGNDGARFLTTTFYDGQGMMVAADSPYQSVEDMDGTTICVLSGTTTELNLQTVFQAAGIGFEPLAREDVDQLEESFTQGQCDGWTSDLSQLAGIRSTWSDGPEALRILDDPLSKEPLTPAVADGDDEWAAVVDWAILATIQAEELGITADNLAEMRESENPDVLRFLGEPVPDPADPEAAAEPFDPGLGLPIDFAAQIVENVGNYGEIYDRNVGTGTPLGLERGLNAQWSDGGLLYAPPYR